jgi:hypothetical protein
MDTPLSRWVRFILFFIAAQAFLFLYALVRPDQILELEPFTASPLNARFIACLYGSTGLGLFLAGIFARTFRQARGPLLGAGVATTVLFVVTLFRLPEIAKFPFNWLASYLIDSILVIIAFWRLGEWDFFRNGWSPHARIWLTNAAILCTVGLLMFVLPRQAVAIWPWAMTEALAQLYGTFFVGLGVLSLIAAQDPEWASARWTATMLCALGVSVCLVSWIHLDRFRPPAATIIWFLFFLAQAGVFGALLILNRARVAVKELAA